MALCRKFLPGVVGVQRCDGNLYVSVAVVAPASLEVDQHSGPEMSIDVPVHRLAALPAKLEPAQETGESAVDEF